MADECLKKNQLGALPLFVRLAKGLDACALPSIGDLKILIALNEVAPQIPALGRKDAAASSAATPLLPPRLFEKIVANIERRMMSLERGDTPQSVLLLKMVAGYFSGMTVSLDPSSQQLLPTLQAYLEYHDFPDVDSEGICFFLFFSFYQTFFSFCFLLFFSFWLAVARIFGHLQQSKAAQPQLQAEAREFFLFKAFPRIPVKSLRKTLFVFTLLEKQV